MSRHESDKWFDTKDGVEWGDGGLIALRDKDGSIVFARLKVDEQYTGEDEIPMPTLTSADGSDLQFVLSFFDFEEWKYA